MAKWVVVGLLLLGSTACEQAGAPTSPPTSPAPASSTPATSATSMSSSSIEQWPSTPTAGAPTTRSGSTTWTVVEVVDGDTMRVAGPGGEHRVRLIGVNAPEEGECFHAAATARLRDLAAGADVRLVRDESDTDRFGRLLRFVETVDGVDVGGELVRAGAARSQRYEPDVARNDRYDELQGAARAAGRGLWAPDACGAPVAPAAVTIDVEIRYDAPGDDNHNLNDEWVRFTNAGDAPLDLTGWLVADESASHRYRFDALVLPPGGTVTLFTGCGADSSTERYWCNADSAVWNNSGDTVFLHDPQGNTVLAESYRE